MNTSNSDIQNDGGSKMGSDSSGGDNSDGEDKKETSSSEDE